MTGHVWLSAEDAGRLAEEMALQGCGGLADRITSVSEEAEITAQEVTAALEIISAEPIGPAGGALRPGDCACWATTAVVATAAARAIAVAVPASLSLVMIILLNCRVACTGSGGTAWLPSRQPLDAARALLIQPPRTLPSLPWRSVTASWAE